MTDRVKGFTVALEKDIRIDDAQAVTAAIRQIRGVADVQPVTDSPNDLILEMRILNDIKSKLFDFISKL